MWCVFIYLFVYLFIWFYSSLLKWHFGTGDGACCGCSPWSASLSGDTIAETNCLPSIVVLCVHTTNRLAGGGHGTGNKKTQQKQQHTQRRKEGSCVQRLHNKPACDNISSVWWKTDERQSIICVKVDRKRRDCPVESCVGGSARVAAWCGDATRLWSRARRNGASLREPPRALGAYWRSRGIIKKEEEGVLASAAAGLIQAERCSADSGASSPNVPPSTFSPFFPPRRSAALHQSLYPAAIRCPSPLLSAPLLSAPAEPRSNLRS